MITFCFLLFLFPLSLSLSLSLIMIIPFLFYSIYLCIKCHVFFISYFILLFCVSIMTIISLFPLSSLSLIPFPCLEGVARLAISSPFLLDYEQIKGKIFFSSFSIIFLTESPAFRTVYS